MSATDDCPAEIWCSTRQRALLWPNCAFATSPCFSSAACAPNTDRVNRRNSSALDEAMSQDWQIDNMLPNLRRRSAHVRAVHRRLRRPRRGSGRAWRSQSGMSREDVAVKVNYSPSSSRSEEHTSELQSPMYLV